MLVMVLYVACRTEGVFLVTTILDLAVFSVHDELDVVLNRHVEGEVGLAVDEGLERITQMFEGQMGELLGEDGEVVEAEKPKPKRKPRAKKAESTAEA